MAVRWWPVEAAKDYMPLVVPLYFFGIYIELVVPLIQTSIA